VLAVARAVARRHSLDPPVPVTNVFPALPESDESDWQTRVLDHLGLRESWRRLEFTHELDLVGPVAGAALRRHGLLYPANTHFHAPMLDEAGGGSLLTGWGGDEVLGGRHAERAISVLRGRVRPMRSDARRIVFWAAPARLRKAAMRRSAGPAFEWLTLHGRRLARAAWASDRAGDPLRWSRHIERLAGLREMTLCHASFGLLSESRDVRMLHPFADPRFLAALARRRPLLGPGGRTAIMQELFGDLLPEPVLARRSKATFGPAFFGPETRRFTRGFDGDGIDTELVNLQALREVWRDPATGIATALLVQRLWLK
jgi:Asparagine synthase